MSQKSRKGVSASFAERANEAAFWEAWVGAILTRSGLYVVQHPFNLAREDQEVSDFAHSWDLDVATTNPCDFGDEDGVTVPVEVKSVNKTFETPESWPMPELIVCSFASHYRKWPGTDRTQRDFLFASRYTGAIVWLPRGTKLTISEVTDPDRDETYRVVRASRDDLRALDVFAQSVKAIGS